MKKPTATPREQTFDPRPPAMLRKESVEHLFDVWGAVDAIADVLAEQSDETTTGLAGALRLAARELGRIHMEAAESLRPPAAAAGGAR